MSGERERHTEQINDVIRFIERNDDFLVVSHVQPDGDAVASTCAVGWILDQLNKKYTMVNEETIPPKYRLLPGADQIVRTEDIEAHPPFAHVISVDCADMGRIGSARNLFAEGVSILNIDHHLTNDRFGTVNFIRPDAAASVEILYDLIETLGLPWKEPIATCIYAGLLTDTGGFRYANTTPGVMQIASTLLLHGADGPRLADELLEKVSAAHVLLLRHSLSTLSFDHNRQIAWMSVTSEHIRNSGATDEDSDGLVQYPRNIEGVEVGILFKERADGAVKVSLRSAGTVNVAAIAQSFGGGGHVLAAGCTVHDSLDTAIDVVVKAVKTSLL